MTREKMCKCAEAAAGLVTNLKDIEITARAMDMAGIAISGASKEDPGITFKERYEMYEFYAEMLDNDVGYIEDDCNIKVPESVKMNIKRLQDIMKTDDYGEAARLADSIVFDLGYTFGQQCY